MRHGLLQVPPLILLYAVLNAALYSMLLPLWEGFDEPFHFGYVQSVANGTFLPVAGTARLTRETEASVLLAPVSPSVKRNLPRLTTYKDFFSLPPAQQMELRRRLEQIPPAWRWQPSTEFLNYEAQHPPLAYALLALPERLLSGCALPRRVLALRFLAALAGALMLYAGAVRLFAALGITECFQRAALFCVFSSQMLWAAIAHVSNDWLAVPAALWILVAAIHYAARPTMRRALILAVLLALGLWIKAYFLALLPFVLGIYALRRRWRELFVAALIVLVLAGPWYARNVLRYGNLSGMQEIRAGVSTGAIVRAMPSVNWPVAVWRTAHQSFWTANNMFRAFSSKTVHLTIGLMTAALLLWAAAKHERAEWVVVAYCGFFVAAFAYATLVSYVYSRGEVAGPSPWYTQVLLAPLMGLAFLGASRSRAAGKIVAISVVLVSGYVLSVTYAFKLIPLYAGFEERTTLAAVAMLYFRRFGWLSERLAAILMAPVVWIFLLTAVVSVMAVALEILLIRSIVKRATEPCATAP